LLNNKISISLPCPRPFPISTIEFPLICIPQLIQTMPSSSHCPTWWKEATIYQIYPSSFLDSNSDGIGDIPGILAKLPYLKALGVTVVWLCPHYASPQVDMGYDISDYQDIYEKYGTLEDCERLIEECHGLGMKIIFDLVINHTSDQHSWFRESRESKDSEKRDWYIWRPAKYVNGVRKLPNNWASRFSESAWEWDEQTQEYYLHVFAKEQPDLNWENEDCRKAIYETSMRFWLEKGVDGFRVDVVNMYSKVPGLPDAEVVKPESEFQDATALYCNGPRIHEYLLEMNDVFDRYDMMTVGELPATPTLEGVMPYVSARGKQLNMVFNFDTILLGTAATGNRFAEEPWTLPQFKDSLARWQKSVIGTDAWTTSFLENHDQPRSISRFASDIPEYRVRSGKLLAMLLATLSGTLYIYQGQEIGMLNIPTSWGEEEYLDIKSVNYLKSIREKIPPGVQQDEAIAKAMKGLQKRARDNARTPMQWNDGLNAGFSTGKSWMRIHDSYADINVTAQEGDQDSLLSFWKKMIKLRKKYKELFVYGDFEMHEFENKDIFMYGKTGKDEQRALVVLNFTKEEAQWTRPKNVKGKLRCVVSNYGDVVQDEGEWMGRLRVYEGRMFVEEEE
jgi:oligo-1,6-glucosidase